MSVWSDTTGKQLWVYDYPCQYRLSYAGGPRVTPTVDGNRVYGLGAEGRLYCLDVATGKEIWARELKTDYQIEAPIWGFCGHPLVDGDQLICLVGGEGSVLVSFDKATGKELWKSLNAPEPGYCPPRVIEVAGQRQLIIWHPQAVVAVDPQDGGQLWSVDLAPGYGMSITSPQLAGNILYVSGIGNAAAAIELDTVKPGAEVLWRGTGQTAVYCSNSTPLIHQGVIFGVDCRQGQLRAVDLKSGERLWETLEPTTDGKEAGHGTAFLVRNEDHFYLFNEQGELVIATLTRDGYRELGRQKILEPTQEAFGRPVVWSHPAFANRALYARNDKEIVCVSLAKQDE